MSKVRVYEVARELGMKNKELVAVFQSLGFSEVRNHMSAVEAEVVDRLKRRLSRRQESAVVEERVRPTVVKRRARRVAAPPSGAGSAATPPVPVATASEPGRAAAPAAEPSTPYGATAAVPAAEPSVPTAAPAEVPAAKSSVPAAKKSAPAAASAAPEAPASAPSAAAAPVAEATSAAAAPVAASEPLASGVTRQATAPVTAAPAPAAEPERRRPTNPPKRGIEVWGGRPGVPMPQRPQPRSGPPSARRTTYDPRAGGPAGRGGYGANRRPVAGRAMRPAFRRGQHGFQRNQRKGPVHVSTKEMSDHKKVIKIESEISLQNFAGKMSLKVTDVLMRLLSMGMTGVHINTTIDSDTAKLLGGEFGWNVEDVAVDDTTQLQAAIGEEEQAIGVALVRAPVVTVMGHVDHGKTSLLDRIRKANVADGEAGGITQHIGAYRVETSKGTIAFLDTPGHAAFTAMRARGAGVTDIVILVVAADDGVMPQTKEAIAHSKAAGVPIIVAINKIDKPGVDPDVIMRDLASEGLQSEDWGGDTIFCRVSAKTGEGVDQLLEMVLLQAELLELKAHPEKRATGVVVEALLDRGRGPVARVLVQDGTLSKGDILLAGHAFGKVRAMVDEKGKQVKQAGPSTPVEVLGLNEVPAAGDQAHVVKNMRAAEELGAERKKRVAKSIIPKDSRVTLETLTTRLAESEQFELKVIVKADVQGSLEALVHALAALSTDKVKLGVVHTGVGGITETDVNLAVAAKALIIGFSVRPAGKAGKEAESEGIEIRLYDIIYEAIDDVRTAMEDLLPARKVEKELGRAQVRQVFRITKVGVIAGCMVVDGIIKRNAKGRLVREGEVIWTGDFNSLKRFKDDAKEVREGLECGIGLEGYDDLKDGDIVEAFEIEEFKVTL